MRSFIYFLLSGFNSFFPNLNKNPLRVLAYHTVPDSHQFEKQIKYLKSKYNLIDIDQLSNHLYKSIALPENPLLITFDDGDVSVIEKGLPVLKRYRIPSVLFVITGLIDSSNAFWWKRVEEVFKEEGKTYLEARQQVRQLKNISNREREDYLDKLNQINSLQLTINQLKEMEKEGISIANHTHTHPMINKCTNAEIEKELDLARSKFEEWALNGYSVFAYPNGNWDNRTENILKKKGIKMAFLFDHRINKKPINPLRISRIMVDTNTELNEFKAKVSGVHSGFRDLKNKLQFKH